MYNNSINKSLKMSRLSKFFGVIALSLTLVFNGGQANGQDSAAASGATPAAAPAPASGGGDVAKGENIFKNNCAQCHATSDEVLVGPGLKGVRQRTPGEAWLQKWIRNSANVIASGDAYAVQVYNKFQKIPMSTFPNLTDDDITSILDYIDSANAAPATAAVSGNTGTTTDSAKPQSGDAGSPSSLFTFVLVALLVVMLLVLGVLLVIVTILSKAVQPAVVGTDGTPASGNTLVDRLRTGLTNTVNNPIIRSVVVWLFVLIVAKVVIDGSFSVGIQQGYAPKQPIQYSHKLHAGQYKIDCNYCHTGVNKGKSATIPAANICMNCHGVIKKESPEIQKIYAAIENNRPIEWIRVHNLPDLAYFNHAQHVNVGNVQCQTCHGEIEKMEVVEQRSSLTMGWCIDCHRKTEVNTKDNAYYDKLVALHRKETKEPLKVANIGGLECSKCHY